MSDGPNWGNLLETWQRVQEQLNRAKDTLGDRRVDAETGGGMVRCVANGRGEILSMSIDPSLLSASNKQMVEDLVVGAVNLAIDRARQVAQDDLTRLAGGMGFPPGFPSE